MCCSILFCSRDSSVKVTCWIFGEYEPKHYGSHVSIMCFFSAQINCTQQLEVSYILEVLLLFPRHFLMGNVWEGYRDRLLVWTSEIVLRALWCKNHEQAQCVVSYNTLKISPALWSAHSVITDLTNLEERTSNYYGFMNFKVLCVMENRGDKESAMLISFHHRWEEVGIFGK